MGDENVDGQCVRPALDDERLDRLIKPYASPVVGDRTIEFTPRYDDAPVRVQLLVVVLALHAFARADTISTPDIGAVRLAEVSDVSVGAAYPVLRQLEQRGVLRNDGDAYRLAPGGVDAAAEILATE